MNDPRILQHAKVLVEHSCKVKRGDFVLILATPEAHDLVVAIAGELGRLGAQFLVLDRDTEVLRAYMVAADDQTLSTLPKQTLSVFEQADCIINLTIASPNSQELSDVTPHKLQLRARSMKPTSDAVMTKRWNITQHPTRAQAQEAKMSFEAYCDFVYSATLRDWAKMVAEMQVLYDRMAAAKQVHIMGMETDITFSVDGRKPIIDGGEKNLPGGEVFISPVDSSVDGKVYFDLPINYQGREVSGARLTFKNGEVVDSAAEEGQETLREMLASDDGARRLGELGIGMNRGINRFTKNILFDEKMGDTIHMAVGASFEESGGTNKSAIHIDMIKSMKKGGTIYFDGAPIYKDGKFEWE